MEDETVRLWSVGTGAPLRTLGEDMDWVESVLFSPDGETLVSASSDGTVHLWSVGTGAPPRTLAGHTGWVRGVSFSSDGETVASGSSETAGNFTTTRKMLILR